MSRLLLACFIAPLLALLPARADQTRSVTITIKNETPKFKAIPSIEVFGAPSKEFTALDANKFQYTFNVDESEWFNVVDIKIRWKEAFLNNDGTNVDFVQRIKLRIRRDFPNGFSFPIFFSNARSNPEMYRLENIHDPTDQFEVFFRAWQIAAYYRGELGVANRVSKRASKLFFYAAVALAEEPDYFVVMSDDAEKYAVDAFGPDRFSARANVARSAYWYDLNKVNEFTAKDDCKTARLLMQVFRALAEQHAEEFQAKYKNAPKILDEKDQVVEAKCRAK